MISLLRSLEFLRTDFLQRCQPYGLEKSVSIGVHPWLKIQTPIAPIVHPKLNTGKEFPSAGIRLLIYCREKAQEAQSYFLLCLLCFLCIFAAIQSRCWCWLIE